MPRNSAGLGLDSDSRGWTLDVLNVVRSLGSTEFSLADVYAFADELRRLHPDNLHIRDKIRPAACLRRRQA